MQKKNNMKSIYIILFMALGVYCNAQSDYSEYLNMANEQLKNGNCEKAQKYYNIYKVLTNTTYPLIENGIKECWDSKKVAKKYKIGDDAKDFIGKDGFRIAYLDASGKHGFAIRLRGKTISEGFSPTLAELKLMYKYRYILGLEGEYWSKDDTHKLTSDVYTFDFSTGKTHKRHSGGGFYLKRNYMDIERF